MMECPECEGSGWVECDEYESGFYYDEECPCEGCEDIKAWQHCDKCNGTGEIAVEKVEENK